MALGFEISAISRGLPYKSILYKFCYFISHALNYTHTCMNPEDRRIGRQSETERKRERANRGGESEREGERVAVACRSSVLLYESEEGYTQTKELGIDWGCLVSIRVPKPNWCNREREIYSND